MINWVPAGLVAAFAPNGAISRLTCRRVGSLRGGMLDGGRRLLGKAKILKGKPTGRREFDGPL